MVGVEISFVDPEIQKWIYEYIRENGQVKLNQVTAVRSQIQEGAITQAKLISILNSTQPGRIPAPKVVLTEKRLRKFFPEDYTVKEMRNVIEDLLEKWKMNMEDESHEERFSAWTVGIVPASRAEPQLGESKFSRFFLGLAMFSIPKVRRGP